MNAGFRAPYVGRFAALFVISTSIACSGSSGGGTPTPTASATGPSAQTVPIDARLELPSPAPLPSEDLAARVADLSRRASKEDYDIQARAAALKGDYQAMFRFVRDEIGYEAYSGVLRDAGGTLAARAGNSVDRSLLLASLLGSAGITVRFAACELPADRADALYQRLFESAAGATGEPSDAFIKRVFTRARRDYAVVRAARGVPSTDAAAASRAQAIKDARGHVWVQANLDGAWVDLDSAFADSEPKSSYCSPREIVTTVPNAWHQQVTLRVSAERVEDGALGTAPVLTVTMRAVDLAGEAIFLMHVPHKGSGGLGLSLEAASARGMWTPVLLIGPRVVTGQPIDFSDDGGSGLLDALGGGGSSALVAEWLEVEVLRPDGRKDVTRRALFDRAGAVWRASADHDAAKLKPIPRSDAGPIAALNLHNVLFSTGPMNLSAYGKAISWVAEQGEGDPDAVIAARLYPFAVANFAALVWTDHFIVPAVNNGAVRLYVDSPRVVIVSNSLEADGGVSEIYDLRRDRLFAVARDAAGDALVADQKLWFGLLEGALEHETVARDVALSGGDPASVASTSAALTPDGVRLVTSQDLSALAEVKDLEKTAWLRASVQGGHIAVVPRSSFGNGPLAFWQISPTGDARAVAGDDLNMSSGRVASGGRRAGNPISRPPPQGGKTIFIPDSPGGAKRGKIEYTGGARPGEEYSMVLSISQAVVVGVTALGIVQYHLWKKESQAAYDAWNAAEQEKQDRALRAAGVGR